MAKRYQLGVELDRVRFKHFNAQAERFSELMETMHSVTIPRPGAAYMRWLIDRGDEFLNDLEEGE